VVTQKVSPKGPHSLRQSMFTTRVNIHAVPPRVALAFTEQRTTFAGRSYVPDVSIYQWDRIPWTGPADVEDDFPLPPDVAFEIVSPGQTFRKLSERCQWYVDNGVGMALLIEPKRRWVRLFRPGQDAQDLSLTDTIDFGAAVPGFTLLVSDLFSLLDPA
jgi:Uma2 family endonuclease